MAQGQPRGGCFRCGNPHHSAWECKADLSHDEEKVNRRVNQDHHYLTHPEVKRTLNQKSHSLYMARREVKSQADNIQWESIVNDLRRLIPMFREWEARLTAARNQPVQLSPQAADRHFQLILSIQNEVRTVLDAVRNLTAAGNQKVQNARHNLAGGFSELPMQEISIIFGKLQELTGLRDNVWQISVNSLKSAKNVSESISDLRALETTISRWCTDMLAWLLSDPTAVDHARLDEQVSQQRADFLQMQERARYICERTPLEAEVNAVVESVRRQLEAAEMRRADFGRGYCFNCGVRRAEITCRCSFPICRRCFGEMPRCPKCQMRNVCTK